MAKLKYTYVFLVHGVKDEKVFRKEVVVEGTSELDARKKLKGVPVTTEVDVISTTKPD